MPVWPVSRRCLVCDCAESQDLAHPWVVLIQRTNIFFEKAFLFCGFRIEYQSGLLLQLRTFLWHRYEQALLPQTFF